MSLRQRALLAEYSPEAVLVVVCTALSLYNAIELLLLIFSTFKRRAGLYFWSLLLASFGIMPYSVGLLMVYFDLTHAYAGMTVDTVGWILLVSGQSCVLYSRLHLVLQDYYILRAVLWMIVVNGVVWHTSMTVLLFASHYTPADVRPSFSHVFNIMERIQITFFCVQEFIISGLYLWQATEILRTAIGYKRQLMWQLFAINVLIVVMNIGLLVVEYLNHFVWEQALKVVTYSVKLKIEFAVLNQLVKFVQQRGSSNATCISCGTTDFINMPETSTAKRKGLKSASAPEAIHFEGLQGTTSRC